MAVRSFNASELSVGAMARDLGLEVRVEGREDAGGGAGQEDGGAGDRGEEVMGTVQLGGL